MIDTEGWMALDDGDYNPVAAQGKIEKPAGILGRRRLRDSIPPVEYGYERVFVDADGQIRSGRGATTAGERYWASPGMWLNVDTGDHDITYRFTYREPDGTAGYNIEIYVTVRVSNAQEAVRRKVSGVRRYAESALSTKVSMTLTQALPHDGASGVRMLNTRRDQIAQRLRDAMTPGAYFTIANWLTVTVTDVSVSFDAATSAHHDSLIATARGVEDAEAKIRLRETWSNYLEPQMADPLKRAVATIAADPTQENIQRVASQLDADDRWRSGEVIGILNTLIKENYVEDINQLNAIKAIVETLQRTSAYQSREAVDAGSQGRVLPGAVAHKPDVSAEVASQKSDNDWAE
jgi:hypothetical protein